jgi:hypothetical protein
MTLGQVHPLSLRGASEEKQPVIFGTETGHRIGPDVGSVCGRVGAGLVGAAANHQLAEGDKKDQRRAELGVSSRGEYTHVGILLLTSDLGVG